MTGPEFAALLPGWEPEGYQCIDTAPKNGSLLKCCEVRSGVAFYWAVWRDGEWRTVPKMISMIVHPTHWKKP